MCAEEAAGAAGAGGVGGAQLLAAANYTKEGLLQNVKKKKVFLWNKRVVISFSIHRPDASVPRVRDDELPRAVHEPAHLFAAHAGHRLASHRLQQPLQVVHLAPAIDTLIQFNDCTLSAQVSSFTPINWIYS